MSDEPPHETPPTLDGAAHPQLAPSRSRGTPTPLTADTFLDDRGRPVILAEFATVRESVYGTAPPFPWRRVVRWTLVAVCGTWILLSAFNAISPRIPMGCVWVLGPLIPAMAWSRGGKTATVKKDRAGCARLVRAGRCGGCGFSLREIGHDADGYVACPECGAAWHQDRWRNAPQDSIIDARTLLETPAKAAPQRWEVDDRGLPLATSMLWEPKWYSAAFDGFIRDMIAPERWAAASRFHADGSAALVRQRIRYALWFAAGVCALASLLAIIGFDKVSTDAYTMSIVSSIVGLATAMWIAQTKVDARGLALKHGLCPAYGEALDLDQPRQFDGCIQCAKCASAWRVPEGSSETRVQEPRTTPTMIATENREEPARG